MFKWQQGRLSSLELWISFFKNRWSILLHDQAIAIVRICNLLRNPIGRNYSWRSVQITIGKIVFFVLYVKQFFFESLHWRFESGDAYCRFLRNFCLYFYSSRHCSTPRHFHLAAVKWIIHYLLGIAERGLFFRAELGLHLHPFCDADLTYVLTHSDLWLVGAYILACSCFSEMQKTTVFKSSTFHFYLNLDFFCTKQSHFMQITLVQFESQLIQSFMNRPNTLKSSAIMFGKHLMIWCYVPSKSQMSSPKHCQANDICFCWQITANWFSCINLRGFVREI